MRERIELNPLRAFDSDHPGTRAVMESAPRLLDHLDAEDAEHFAEVRALLDEASVPYEIDPTLVRGLDYYTRTVFEFTSDALGAQSGVGGGGRYDGLVESSAARPPRASAGRRASSGSCSQARPRRAGLRWSCSSRSTGTARARAGPPSGCSPRPARQVSERRWTSPGAR